MAAATATTAKTAASSLFSVAGKNVLVTGSSRGIGEMIARGFSMAGAHVLVTSRDETACRATATAISQATDNMECHYVTSNLSTRQGCEALAAEVARVFDHKLHVLINNAGTSWGEPLERDSKTNWGFDRVLDLNVKSLFYLTRACLPFLTATATRDDPARIINIGSVTGLVPQNAPTHAYDISKAAVHQLTHKFAAEFAKQHITVNCLAPGFVPSRMSSGLATWGADARELSGTIPLGRMGNADDMAGACLYLSSRAGSWCTGVILNVDGGTIGARPIPLTSNL
jgi:NAD(P)-dependent dehydrogenase (short-subunit alcohol dehydrogenase family)